MKKSLAKKTLVLVTLITAVCMSTISYAENTSQTKPAAEKVAALQQLDAAAGLNIDDVKVPEVSIPTTLSSFEVNKSTTDCTNGYIPTTGNLVAFNIVLANSCIEQGLTCILNGTPCCSPYECKGKFPNTSCK